jgi:hypothetical protein
MISIHLSFYTVRGGHSGMFCSSGRIPGMILSGWQKRAVSVRPTSDLVTWCGPQELNPILGQRFSRRNLLQSVFVVKTAEYGHHCNAMVLRNAMPFALKLRLRKVSVRNSRSQTGVWSRRVVMNYPLFHDPSDMVFIDGNHEIQTFSTRAAD